ncbi:MAG: FkbM family methyltransferase [Candidatus Nanohaloarchaeota archaeon QJJ-9]|nr:FkbM family methyltransferase [Candidatus Nanohaloarchaeota archaeon QJJ-9]
MPGSADFSWLKANTDNEESRKWVEMIQEWHEKAFEGEFIDSEELFSIDLDGRTIWLRKASAYSSVDILTEIMKDNDHFKAEGFSGEGADVIVDLGANEGYYLLKVKENNPEAKIVAAEPNPLAYEILEKNVESNKISNVKLVDKAVGPEKDTQEFEFVTQSTAVGAKNLDTVDRDWVDKEMVNQVKVETVTLEQLLEEEGIEKIDILKLDVEGMEYDILKESEDLLDRVEKIVVECHSESIQKKVKEILKGRFETVKEENKSCGDLYLVKN